MEFFLKYFKCVNNGFDKEVASSLHKGNELFVVLDSERPDVAQQPRGVVEQLFVGPWVFDDF